MLLAVTGLLIAAYIGVLALSVDRVGVPTAVDLGPVPGDAERGAQLVGAYGCGTCHTVPGVRGARGTVGPHLGAFAERRYIAGALVNTPENLVRWIMAPQRVEPGTAMPDLAVGADDARDLSAYLYTLR